MRIINGILDTIAVLICFAGIGMIGFVFWFVSLFINFSLWDLAGLVAVIAFVFWRYWRWDKEL